MVFARNPVYSVYMKTLLALLTLILIAALLLTLPVMADDDVPICHRGGPRCEGSCNWDVDCTPEPVPTRIAPMSAQTTATPEPQIRMPAFSGIRSLKPR